MRTIQLKLTKRQSSSAAIVASDDDLLTQILLRLPAKSLLLFKCVSKHWLSLITSPYFSKLRTRHPISASGLILHRSSHLINPDHEFVPFITQNPAMSPFRKFVFIDDPSGIRILQSCNGLLFCCSFRCHEPRRNLVYDPSKSTHYKVICVKGYELDSWNYQIEVYPSETGELASWHYQIEVYSSETRQWRVSGETFTAHYSISLKNGVYWNGAIHWVCDREHSLYFDVDQEKIENMPMPPAFNGWEETRIEYFGESCDHLHLVEVNSRHATLFNIYEMERDRTMWLLRYHVDLDAVVTAFPHMVRHYLPPTDYHHYAMFVLDMVRGDQGEEEDSFMRYNLVDKSFYELCDFARLPSHG